MGIDENIGNNILRKISTEPKALLLYWLLQQEEYHSLGQIRDGISDEFDLDVPSFHCLKNALILGYFRESLSAITEKPIPIRNTKPGPKFVKGYRLNIKSRQDYSHLREIAGHALYGSATLTERLGRLTTLNQIFYGAPWKEESDTGSPAHVAAILSTLNRFKGQLLVADLSNLIDFDANATLSHLQHLDKMDYVRLSSPDKITYRLIPNIELDGIIDRNKKKLGINYKGYPTCVCQIIQFLKGRAEGASLQDILGNIQNKIPPRSTQDYNREYAHREISSLLDIGIVQTVGHMVQAICDGREVVNTLIDPILTAVRGDDSLLITPTNQQIKDAIGNYETAKGYASNRKLC